MVCGFPFVDEAFCWVVFVFFVCCGVSCWDVLSGDVWEFRGVLDSVVEFVFDVWRCSLYVNLAFCEIECASDSVLCRGLEVLVECWLGHQWVL